MIRYALLLLFVATCALAQAPATLAPATFPALNIQVTVGTQLRPDKKSPYWIKTLTISPKITIDGPSRMVAVPAAEATMVIVTMNEGAKDAGKDGSYRVESTETIEIPPAPTGDRRQFSFTESTLSYDTYHDPKNMIHYVYKYFVFGLRDPATGALVDFKTNNVELASYVKTHPEKRQELLSLAKKETFPATFK